MRLPKLWKIEFFFLLLLLLHSTPPKICSASQSCEILRQNDECASRAAKKVVFG